MEKVGLKLNIQKTKIMVSGPITSWQIERNDILLWRQGFGTVVSQLRDLRPKKTSYWYFPPKRKLGCPPHISELEKKSRAAMKPGLSPWTTHCVLKGAFKLSSAPVYMGQSACHRDTMLTITLLNSFLLAFHMPHKILVLLAFPYWNCTLNKDLLSC